MEDHKVEGDNVDEEDAKVRTIHFILFCYCHVIAFLVFPFTILSLYHVQLYYVCDRDRDCYCCFQSLSLSLSFNGHFPGERGLAGVY